MSEKESTVPENLIEDIHYHALRYDDAKSRSNAGYHLTELLNKIHDLASYHSGYMYENGTLPWQRDDDEERHIIIP